MKTRVANFLGPLVLGCWLAAAAGCSLLPVAKPDPTRFYVLTTRATAAAAPAGAPAVQLRPVEVAGYLRSRPLIVRRGGNELEFREYARWGEPLEQGIGRVLREELRARGVVVPSGPGRDSPAFDYHLTVRVLACEGTVAGAVDFRAVWELTRAGEKPVAAGGGEFRAEALRWDGKSEASLAAQLSEAVAGLAAEIAVAVARKG